MKLKLNITLDPEYVLTKKYCAVLPIEEIKDRIRKLELPDTVIDNESITGLSLQTEYRNCESFREAILKILIEVTKLPPECFVKDIDENTYYIEYNDTLTVTISEIGANAPAVYESYRKIEEKVGWAEFKELCHERLLVSPEIKRNSIYKSFLFQNFLISVNDGCGLSTALDDFMKLISDLELFEFAKKQPVIEMRLSSKSEPDSMPQALQGNSSARYALTFQDIRLYRSI